jgi:phage FluMu protein gp41
MRLATAADEIIPMKDPKVQANPAYLTVILLSRVVTKLGTVESLNTKVIENLFASDLAYLQEFYQRINRNSASKIKVTCPKCKSQFEIDVVKGKSKLLP